MILLADHQDSFTRNLEHLLAGFDRVVVRDRRELTPELIEQCHLLVLSPGPGKPSDYPETLDLFRSCVGYKPVLGICLGFQLGRLSTILLSRRNSADPAVNDISEEEGELFQYVQHSFEGGVMTGFH